MVAGRRRRWLCSGCALATSREEARTQSPSREGVAKGAKGEGGRYWRGKDGAAHTSMHGGWGGGGALPCSSSDVRTAACLSKCTLKPRSQHAPPASQTHPSHTFTPRPRRLHNTPPPASQAPIHRLTPLPLSFPYRLHNTRSAEASALHIVLGDRHPLDVARVDAQVEGGGGVGGGCAGRRGGRGRGRVRR